MSSIRTVPRGISAFSNTGVLDTSLAKNIEKLSCFTSTPPLILTDENSFHRKVPNIHCYDFIRSFQVRTHFDDVVTVEYRRAKFGRALPVHLAQLIQGSERI